MTYLEKPSTPGELKHYGIKGMKWGVRRGGLGSRIKGALADRNQQQTALAKRYRRGDPKHLDEHIGYGLERATSVTKNRFNKKLDKVIMTREAQKKRIDSGKLAARDYLEIFGHVGMIDLAFSRRDVRG